MQRPAPEVKIMQESMLMGFFNTEDVVFEPNNDIYVHDEHAPSRMFIS